VAARRVAIVAPRSASGTLPEPTDRREENMSATLLATIESS
jgi:hypothetical protein